MWESLLAQLPYYVCSLAAFLAAIFCIVAVRKRLRPWWWLVGAAAFVALGVAFFLIAATAIPGGHLPRAAVAAQIRWLYLIGGVLWCALLLLLARASVRVKRRDDST